MRKMARPRRALWVLGIIAACADETPPAEMPKATTAQWDDTAGQEMRTMVEGSFRAIDSGDMAAFRSLMAPDGTVVSYDLDMQGQPVTYETTEDAVKSVESMIDTMKKMGGTMQSKITRLDCRATATFGVCAIEWDSMGTMQGKTETYALRATTTARKGDGGWKFTHWHGSMAKMPPMPSAASVEAPKYDLTSMNTKDLKWEKLEGGIKMAVVSGDPKAGSFTAYVELPKGFSQPQHFHSATQWIQVVKGTLTITDTDGKKVEVKQGGFLLAPSKMSHVTVAKGGATLFVVSDGPFDVVPSEDKNSTMPVEKAKPAK